MSRVIESFNAITTKWLEEVLGSPSRHYFIFHYHQQLGDTCNSSCPGAHFHQGYRPEGAPIGVY